VESELYGAVRRERGIGHGPDRSEDPAGRIAILDALDVGIGDAGEDEKLSFPSSADPAPAFKQFYDLHA
tara:strand:- start:25541 stop:25747 length:207 start_codon:yes stop_codon:yes gene_type:complete